MVQVDGTASWHSTLEKTRIIRHNLHLWLGGKLPLQRPPAIHLEAALNAASLFARAVSAGDEDIVAGKFPEQFGPLREIGGENVGGIAGNPLR
jgi:hypothetical protein